MLRITVHNSPQQVTLQLEGRLAGSWVKVLEECWQRTQEPRPVQTLIVDLTGVTSIDATGQACLEAMHKYGAEFVAADPLTSGIVAEITQNMNR